ncbi:hypothetical protein ACP4OV_023515 [Aristida adscensionis]
MEMAAKEEDAGGGSPLNPRLAPLLLYDHGGKTAGDEIDQASDAAAGDLVFYSIPRRQLVVARVDEMKDHRCWTTPQGWLLMASPSSPADTFLWDPFTGGRISLPADCDGFLTGDARRRCLLSRKPAAVVVDDDDPSCIVVLVADLTGLAFWHCRVGGAAADRRWLKQACECPAALGAIPGAVLWAMSHLAAVGGRFVTVVRGMVAELELSPGRPVFTVVTPVDEGKVASPPANCFREHLVESRGDLFRVRFRWPEARPRSFFAGIGVFRLDLTARLWVKAESLDGMAFVFDDQGQFGASFDPREAGLKDDCIYYYMPNDKALHVYDMERGTTALHDPGACLPDHCSPKMVLMPTC